MKSGWGARGWCVLLLSCLSLAAAWSLAQNNPPANSAAATRAVLVEKAKALEARGRPDMAVQLWQQILLSEPNNAAALAGLARDYKLMGNGSKAQDALDQLRAVNPNDPNIARIEAMSSSATESEQLRQAGELAKQGKPEDAMRIYRQIYGDQPPNGPIALAYYQTLYATPNGKEAAVAGMRALAQQNPGDPQFAIALGTMLTYDARTRSEGIRILEAHPQDPTAQGALRQALIWNAANPASAAELRQYLKAHPQDMEVARDLKQEEAKAAQMSSGIARTPEERAAFAALNEHRLDEAEKRFDALLAKEPSNGRVVAGMGFLRMQQQNFGAAISYLEQAEADGYKVRIVENALAGSRFWYTMSEATQAFANNQLDVAEAKFREALVMNPRSPEALNGLAGLLVKEQHDAQAAGVYEQLIQVRPDDADGWRGLFLAYARDNQEQKALATMARFPAPVRAAMARDPDYLRALAGIDQDEGRNDEAQRVLAQALALPFPGNGSTLQLDTRLQYAGILLEARRYNEAADLYVQVLHQDPGNLAAWEGLVTAHHNLGQDTQAIDDVQRMPAATYESALTDPGFLSMLGAIYQQANQFEVAQGFLERAARLTVAKGAQPGIDLQLQIADIDLLRNDPDRAYAIYHQILVANPDNAKAWQGLISALQSTSRNTQAIQELAQIPAGVRKQLESNIEFVQTEAGLYAAVADMPRAFQYMKLVEDHYARLHRQPPAGIDIENAWLLYNLGDDRALYPSLMRLGGRADLTLAQREQVQDIWANWSVRRAAMALDNGNYRRAIDILDAARLAFPNNLAVQKAVAGGYARLGRGKEALAIFKAIPMQDASSGDFQGAIGSALAANDKTQAEIWLRQALDRYPRDPAILTMAAQYEQARGDNERAADYYRASLAAMPRTSPVDRLAHLMVYPEEDTRPHKAVTAADLQRLLNPDNEPFEKTTTLPSLPAYGVDPYNGTAPVVLPPQSEPSPQSSAPVLNNPASNLQPAPASGQSPPIVPIPNGELQAPLLVATPAPVSSGGTGAAQMGSQSLVTAPQISVSVPNLPLQANPAHSLASDAYKGLIFSLMATGRNAEALGELNKIPPDVRNQLEADIEFVQGIASLYLAVGDTARAQAYLNRVENYYLLHRSNAPAGLEIQHAWLLYNLHDAAALYPVLMSLDARADLTAAQRADLQNLWASWAVRRASEAMDRGNMIRGVEILEAASQDYPNNMTVRRAVAAAYARVGRAADALALFKTIPLGDASPGDFDGAISAAMGAGDMAQAESWLRVALSRYPNDPQVLGLAARFEQARGNSQRAADFWRAALAAMPPGSAIEPLPSVLKPAPGSYRTPEPGDSKKLLDPRLDPQSSPSDQAPLPAWQPQPAEQQPAARQPSPDPATLQPPVTSYTQPTAEPLPLPQSAPAYAPADGQGSTQPAPAQPIFAPQVDGNSLQPYMGRVDLPPSQANVEVTGPDQSPNEPPRNTAQTAEQPPIVRPALSAAAETPAANLRIESQPMDAQAAQAQAQFAEQTDAQLTQGSASVIHNLPNAPVKPISTAENAPQSGATPDAGEQYTMAQYTPSAQEAATGAYSAPRQTASQPQQPATPPPATTKRRKRRKKTQNQQTLGTVPIQQNAQPLQTPPQENPPPESTAPAPSAPPPPQYPSAETGAGLSDQELEQRNLPPLSGPWVRTQRAGPPLSPRDQAEMQLQAIESGYSGWLGGTTVLNYRQGNPGYDQLAAFEAPFEASTPLGFHARLTVIGKPVFLDSGQANGNATISVITTSSPGAAAAPTPIEEPIGTYLPGTTADPNPPPQQNAAGLGGEVQLAFPHFAIAAGYTPWGFLVSTFTARAFWRPGNGPFTFTFVRDPQTDSQLSYSGLRDPQGTTLGTEGQIWGGVVHNGGEVQFGRSDAQSGYYFSAGGQYLTGYNVEKNTRIDGTGGAYWRVFATPEYGALNIGTNFFAMHYSNNQNAFTLGMGGYFSPQAYFLANVPFTWQGHYDGHWHYNIMGALGVQAFQQDETPLWPLAAQKSIETGNGNPMIPALTDVYVNYDLRQQLAYQIGDHWFIGNYFEANDSRNYNFASVGFFVRYTFREQPSTAAAPTGLFPSDGLRPFTVP